MKDNTTQVRKLDPLPLPLPPTWTPYPLPGPLDPLPLAQPDLLEDPRIHAEGGEGVAHVEDLVPHHRASEFEAAALRRRRPDWDFEPGEKFQTMLSVSIGVVSSTLVMGYCDYLGTSHKVIIDI